MKQLAARVAFEKVSACTRAEPPFQSAHQRRDNLPGNAAVSVVIISRDRPVELQKTLAAVLRQNVAGQMDVIVVDSSQNCLEVAEIVAAFANVRVVESKVNLGGAGGFAFGILSAIAGGAEWLWLMDDDGRPTGEGVLAALLGIATERDLHAISPIVLSAEDPSKFAFPYPVSGRYVFRPQEIAPDFFLTSAAHLFNGLLIRTAAIFYTGLPDVRMFVRGDEVDFVHRMRRAGLRFGTTARASFEHPSSNDEIHPIWGGRLHVVIPQAGWRRRCQFRNRGFIFLRHRLWFILAIDAVRYPYFFLIKRRGDFAGLKEWLYCTWEGYCGRVGLDRTAVPAALPLTRPLP